MPELYDEEYIVKEEEIKKEDLSPSWTYADEYQKKMKDKQEKDKDARGST